MTLAQPIDPIWDTAAAHPSEKALEAPAAAVRAAPGASGASNVYGGRYRVERIEGVPGAGTDLSPDGLSGTVFQNGRWTRLLDQEFGAVPKAERFTILVTETAADVPVLAMPFVATKARGLRRIEPLDFGMCDYASALVDPQRLPTTYAMQAIWKGAVRLMPRADFISITKIKPAVGGGRSPYLDLPGVRRMELEAFGVSISGPADTVLDRVMRKTTLRDYRRFYRRLERRGAVSFHQARTPADVETMFTALVEQRRARFRDMGRFDLMEREDVVSFYRQAALDGLTGGPARLFCLKVDGRIVATSYGLAEDKAFHLVIQTMTSSDFRNCSPGVLVSGETLEWAAGQGFAYFDFTVGQLPYKLDFGAVASPLYDMRQAVSLQGALAVAAERARGRLTAWLKARPHVYVPLRDRMRMIRRLRLKRATRRRQGPAS